MADAPDFEKQAKDAISACITADPVGGAALTVPIMRQHISYATRMNKDPKPAVIAVCRGSMQAVLVGGQNVPDAALALLTSLPDMSIMMSTGAEELMSWVMEGIADVTPMAGPEVRDALSAKIEEKFMGVSSIFNGFCDAAAKRG